MVASYFLASASQDSILLLNFNTMCSVPHLSKQLITSNLLPKSAQPHFEEFNGFSPSCELAGHQSEIFSLLNRLRDRHKSINCAFFCAALVCCLYSAQTLYLATLQLVVRRLSWHRKMSQKTETTLLTLLWLNRKCVNSEVQQIIDDK